MVLWKDGEMAFVKDSSCCNDNALSDPHSASTITILSLSVADSPTCEVITDDSDDDHTWRAKHRELCQLVIDSSGKLQSSQLLQAPLNEAKIHRKASC